MVLHSTAVAAYSDDWDAEDATQTDHPVRPVVGRIVDWDDRTGSWSAFDDAAIVRVTRSDTSAPTMTDLPAVTF